MRKRLAALLAIAALLAAGVRMTSAYLTDSVSVSASFVAAVPDPTEREGGDATPGPTATPLPTVTPVPCDGEDARLAFRPAAVERRGAAPGGVTLVVANDGPRATALDIVLGLRATGGAGYVSSVAFGNGQVWTVRGQPSATLFAAGNLPPGASVAVPLTVSMLPGWRAEASAAAEIAVAIASARCLDGPQQARMTIRLDRAEGGAASPTPPP